jgi:starch synthase (maltosyl-transferring)
MPRPSEAVIARPSAPAAIDEALTRRAVVERIRPEIDGGRFPIKRTIGETIEVFASIFADGHDVIAALLRDRHVPGFEHVPEDDKWRETPMTLVAAGTDEWTAQFDVAEIGWHEYTIVAWVDRFLTWQRDVHLKTVAGHDVSLELLEGSILVREAAARAEQIGATQPDANWLLERADALSDATAVEDRVAIGTDPELAAMMARYGDRSRATTSPSRRVWVDRERARFGAWYEMFPRSAGPDASRSGTFREACAELPRIADLGFDIVYLPPIHPIGVSFRKGPNNSLAAGPGDPGSPWAIGSATGGHTAVEPGLGTIDDFVAFRQEAERLGMEVALDLAWQCSPDHPWVKEHPEWFRHRPDGTIKYAENPPKKYQDIYPFDFESEDWQALWHALVDVTMFWVDHGVRIFRVDNPHTKTFGFWEWMIQKLHARVPDVIFLSEAFTRPAVMKYLAKAGFTQSYTYFTWRNSKSELVDYFTELTGSEVREYLRPNLFANTPDILHAYLQHGGCPAFQARLILAATLGASYGIYSGFELCESRALKPGSEEYAESEKYQFKKRDWTRAGPMSELICRVNAARHRHPALQFDRTLRFHETDNPEIIAFSKRAGDDAILVVVNLDPHHMQHGFVDVPVDLDSFVVRDVIDDVEYTWHRGRNYVRFDPDIRQGHILWLPKHRT